MAALCRDAATNCFGQLNGGCIPVVYDLTNKWKFAGQPSWDSRFSWPDLLLCGVGLWLLLSPAKYRATARIEVNEDVGDSGYYNYIMKAHPNVGVYDPYFIEYVFEDIQSQEVLGKVIGALNLNVEWGNKYGGGEMLTTNGSIAILKRHLNLGIVRNTKLIDISFTSEDPNEAARIANAIAKAYQNYRVERWQQQTLKGIEVLQQYYQEEELKIQIQQTNVDLLRKELAPQILQAQQERTNRIEIHEATPDQPYWEAKRKLESMLDFHKLLAAKIESEKMGLESQIPHSAQWLKLLTPPNRRNCPPVQIVSSVRCCWQSVCFPQSVDFSSSNPPAVLSGCSVRPVAELFEPQARRCKRQNFLLVSKCHCC